MGQFVRGNKFQSGSKGRFALTSNDQDYGSLSETVETAPTVSAVIVSYYTGPLLARCIAALRLQRHITEIIIVDNGNWPGAVESAIGATDSHDTDNEPKIKILSGHGNIGFSAACNLGARNATGDYLLLVNPDAVMPHEGVATLLKHSDSFEHPWLIGAKLVDDEGIEQTGSRRTTLTPWRAFVEITRLYKLAPRHPYFRRFNLHNDPCPGQVIPVPVTSGACFLLPRKDYWFVDGMDEKYFLHVEDIDFCLRFTKAGGTVYFDPSVRVTHFQGSSRADRLDIEYHKTRGMQLYFSRHFARDYPTIFLWVVYACVWLRFAALAVVHTLKRGLTLLGLRRKRGKGAWVRAHAMASQRQTRK